MDQTYSLCWNNYLNQVTEALGSLRDEEDLVDVTLSCEGKTIKAHKILLSACSPYFCNIFKENPCQHPVIVFQNMPFANLRAIVDFIYCGQVNVPHEELESFMNTAEMLKIKGLSDKENESQTVETSGITKDKPHKEVISHLHESKRSKKLISSPILTSRPNSPPAKRRKSSEENEVNEDSFPIESVVFKEEIESDNEGADMQEEGFSGMQSEVSDHDLPEVSISRPKNLKENIVADLSETSQHIGCITKVHTINIEEEDEGKNEEEDGKRKNEEEVSEGEKEEEDGKGKDSHTKKELNPILTCVWSTTTQHVINNKEEDGVGENEEKDNDTKKGRKKCHSRTKFQEQWVEEFPWVRPVEDNDHAARCILCKKKVKIHGMGKQALRSHARGKNHKYRATETNKLPQLTYPPKINDSQISTDSS